MAGEIKDVSDELFLDLLRKEKRFIVVEFWSPGCSVCKEVEPEVLKAQAELGPDVLFMRINTDHNKQLATRYQITGTPTFVYFCKGDKIGGAIGYMDFSGNLDVCIAIRTAVKKNNKVYVQAGAGIVADSVPEKEFEA